MAEGVHNSGELGTEVRFQGVKHPRYAFGGS